MTMSEPIKFYTTKGEFGFMSNFFRSEVQCFGRKWATSEHAYQAQKFAGMKEEDYNAIHACANPMAAAIVGRDPNRTCRPDWEQVRADVMRFVVFHKFSQNTTIRDALLATGDRPLFEYDTKRGDQYWAVDANGVGKNVLGVILMEVREILREDIECATCVGETDVQTTTPSNIYLSSLHF